MIRNLRHYISLPINFTLLLCAMVPAFAAGAMEYASSSVMSQGKWVKINITQEGMQILSPALLKQMGFSDPSKVHVYGYGGYRLSETLNASTPDDLPIQPVVRTSDGSIIFYGAGLVEWVKSSVKFGYAHLTNFYSTSAPYFLSDREATDPAPEPATTPMPTGATQITTFTQLLVHEQDIFTPAITGADLFGEDFRTTKQRTFSFPIVDPADEQITFNTVFGAKCSNPSTLTISMGNSKLGTLSLPSSTSSDYLITLGQLCTKAKLGDGNSAELSLKYSAPGSPTTARLDYIEASYTRQLRLSNGQLQFRHQSASGEVLVVDGCSSSTQIWDVTDPSSPRPITFELKGSKASFAPAFSGLRTYMAFNPSDVKTAPAKGTKVSNQDIHAMEVPHLVIVVPEQYKTQAERLAQYHRDNDGMTVHLFTPEQVYNEFSSGKPDATAFRKMLKMFYDRGQASSGTRLENFLLFGRPSYDHRLITEIPRQSNYPRLLTWESNISFHNSPGSSTLSLSEGASYCSDTYFGALADNKSSFSMRNLKMQIGVGRMPVKSVQEAKTAVDKLIGYMSSPDPAAWRSQVMIIADDADNGEHLNQAQKMYDNMQVNGNGSDFTFERLYLDSYPLGTGNGKTFPQARERMFKLLDEGVSLLAFVGHANPTSWTHEQIMTYSDINSLSYKHLPIIYHASCEFIRFDSDTESGAETMWLNPTSGAIAFVAANRKVYISLNESVTSAFGKYYFSRDSKGMPLTLGEVFRQTINASTTSDNQLRYALMGDPAMRVPSPYRGIKVDAIDGTDMQLATQTGKLPQVQGMSKMIAKGHITLPSGEIDATFNGTVTVTLFDAERVIETYGHSSADATTPDGKVVIYNDRKNRLATASFPVTNGEWEATLFLPEEIENNFSPARLAMYALSSDGSEAIGSNTDFYVYGWAENAGDDQEGPEITGLGLGSAAFRPGGVVGTNTTLVGHVRDDSGINIASSGIGKHMTVVIDGRFVFDDIADYFTTDPDDPTGGSFSYPLDGLQEGDHELIFQVFDNVGNCSRQALAFKVGGPGLIPDLDLRTDASPASTQANIFITTAEQPSQVLVEVFDIAGRRVWSATPEQLSQSMSVLWDLRTNAGNRVPRGIYLYRATVATPDGSTLRRTRKIAVTEE